MLFALIAYFFAFVITITIAKTKKIYYEDYPYLHLRKYGIVFYSKSKHRLEIADAKIMQVGKVVYVKTCSKMVVIKNVDEIIEKDGFLYFKALGNVSIIFNAKKIYKYFNINIVSEKFDISRMKREATLELLNNLFKQSENERFKAYIHCLNKILNIDIDGFGIRIRQNVLKIPFTVIFRCNNKIQRVNINETF